MNNGRITSGMSIISVIRILTDKNREASTIITGMLKNEGAKQYYLMLDSMDIRGSKISKLFNDCCGNDRHKYSRTLMMIEYGTFTQEEIHGNLNLNDAIPFIDDSLKTEGIPAYGQDFGPTHENWYKYCELQRENFISKLQGSLKQSKAMIKKL